MDDKNENQADSSSLESLEEASTVIEPVAAPGSTPTTTDATASDSTPSAPAPMAPGPKRLGRFHSVNIYMLVFILILIIAIGAGTFAYLSSKRGTTTETKIASQTLDAKALEQLANTSATIGSSNEVLNVQSSAIFAGKVLVRDSLEVAGGMQIGGSLNLSGVSVSGSSNFGQVQVNKNLAVVGDTALQGSLTVQKSLSVNGGGTFNGPLSATQVTANSLQLNGDLTLTHHITAGGPTPSRSNGGALGNGGTASVSGSDTSGSISINTGDSPAAGCFITVSFVTKFNATPHVLITPVGSSAGSVTYYVNRSTSNFSVCASTNPPANSSFGFDYFVLD